jgi:hypothetical protein
MRSLMDGWFGCDTTASVRPPRGILLESISLSVMVRRNTNKIGLHGLSHPPTRTRRLLISKRGHLYLCLFVDLAWHSPNIYLLQ